MIKNQGNLRKDNTAHSLIASKPLPLAPYFTFPLWHIYAITPIALWLIPPANAFSHSLQSKKKSMMLAKDSLQLFLIIF